MGAGILALIGVTVASAMTELLLPEESKNGTRYFLHFLTALAVLLLLMQPLVPFLQNAQAFLEGDLSFIETETTEETYRALLEEAVNNRSAEQLKEGLYDFLRESYSLRDGQCEVWVHLKDTGHLARVEVRLSGAGLLQDPQEIENALLELLECEVEVR